MHKICVFFLKCIQKNHLCLQYMQSKGEICAKNCVLQRRAVTVLVLIGVQ